MRLMPKEIAEIKSLMDQNIGEKIIITVQLGRNKKRTRRGVLKETYRSVFVVDLEQEANTLGCVSYSYCDVLTKAIDVDFAQ